MSKYEFTKNVQKMINPIDIGTIHFLQSYAESIPIDIQHKIVSSSGKKNPYMGFIVEPYSFFLCYEIKDLEWAKKLIPDNYRMIKSKIFEEDEYKYYSIFGTFNVQSSAFWGTRMEFYIIAENKDTGLMSWIIVDYDTNTVGIDEKHGLRAGNTEKCILTTDYDGEVIVDIESKGVDRKLVFNSSIENGKTEKLYERLWLEGNLSVTYGRELSKNRGEAFSVTFNPKEVEKGIRVPYEDVNIEINNWFPGLFEEKPSNILCFKYAQHYLADSPGHFSNIKNKEELTEFFNNVDFTKIPKYSSKPLKKLMELGQLISLLTIVILVVLLILK